MGERSIMTQLRVGARYAPAIAFSAARFDVGDNLICMATAAMRRADDRALGREKGTDDDEDDTEAYYLLGLLVGLEMAGGAR